MKQTENLYAKDSIRCYSGTYVNLLKPTPDMIHLEDIAWGLSQRVRFGGHCKVNVTVAEHGLHCMDLVVSKGEKDPKVIAQALLHDAPEAYIGDIPGPIKKYLTEYLKMEQTLWVCICETFGIDPELYPIVKQVDKEVLQFEWDRAVIGDTYRNGHQVYESFINSAEYYLNQL